jgi:hypothetical protein
MLTMTLLYIKINIAEFLKKEKNWKADMVMQYIASLTYCKIKRLYRKNARCGASF